MINPLRMGSASNFVLRYNTGDVSAPGFNPVLSIMSDILNVSPGSTSITFGNGTQSLPFAAQPLVEDYGSITILAGLSILYEQRILVDKPYVIDENLLAQYAPILRFTQGNSFFPTSVEESFNQGQVFLQKGNLFEPIVLGDLGRKANGAFNIDFPDGINSLPNAAKVVYGTAVECVSKPNRIALQYWFHYFRDDKVVDFPVLGNVFSAHEGDWEMITVFLDKNTQNPLGTALSQHFSGQKLLWSHTQKEGMHPVVFISEGSHANYSREGEYKVFFLGQHASTDVALGNGEILSPPGVPGGTETYTLKLLPRITQISSNTIDNWLLFSGKWGSRESAIGDGIPPATPTFNGLSDNPRWLDPCEWASNVPTNVYVGSRTEGTITKFNSITLRSEEIVSGLTESSSRL